MSELRADTFEEQLGHRSQCTQPDMLRALSSNPRSLAALFLAWLSIVDLMYSIGSAHAEASALKSAAVTYDREAGVPLFRHFGPTEYGGGPQNWAVAQDLRGTIYVGNVNGVVLEHDGVHWRQIPVRNKTTVRSLAVDAEGRVYVGAVGELGYLAPDAAGRMHYVSLLDRVPVADRDFADVWRTFATPEGIYFFTFKRLIRIAKDEVRVWNASSTFHLAFNMRGTIFVREIDRGLLKLEGDELKRVPGGERFAREKIHAILPWPRTEAATSDSVLIATRSQGFFLHDGRSFTPWRTEIDAALKTSDLYNAVWLKNGQLAVSTLRRGVFLLDRSARSIGHLDKSTGLPNDTVFDLLEDRQGSLWLALDNGIARVDAATSLTLFSEHSGIEGSTLALCRHAGVLYAGTSSGLYRLHRDPLGTPRFVRVPEVQGQVWAFLDRGDSLLVGTQQGIFEIRGGKITLVRPSPQAVGALLASQLVTRRVFIGLQDGLASMRFEQDHWVDEGAVPELTEDVITMSEELDGRLWLGTTTGVVRVRFGGADTIGARSIQRIESFDKKHGLPGNYNYVYAIDGKQRFATARGIYLFNEATRRFAPDPQFEKLFATGPRKVFPVYEDKNRERIWMHTTDEFGLTKETGAAVNAENGTYRWQPRPLRPMIGHAIEAIYGDADGVMWFGSEDGVYRYDPHRPVDYDQAFDAFIRRISTRSNKLIFGGTGTAATPKLSYEENALRFEFAAPFFGQTPNRFQVFLEGVDEDWSPWSAEAYRDYTNLREGTYLFRVRAMNEYDAVSREGHYAFRILPPWHRTWLAYLAYLLSAAVIVMAASRWRSLALRRRNRELARLVSLRTKELSSANHALSELSATDALTGLKNRRYFIDHIEHDVASVRRRYREFHNQVSDEGRSNTDLIFLLIDIDHFKAINDSHGHAAGDRVLEQFARIVRSVCRDVDMPVRWGGEEFLIVARFATCDGGGAIAERIRTLTEAHIFQLSNGRSLRATCSIGFASYPVFVEAPEQSGWEDAIELADHCLYEAKSRGRNAWVGVRSSAAPWPSVGSSGKSPTLEVLVAQGYVRLQSSFASAVDLRTSAA